ncbi:MAG: hypothetical protein JWN83_1250 [Chitinophagaceae bacterium]|nr:hypothetical protein [Chitinophagaceae bacterium]
MIRKFFIILLLFNISFVSTAQDVYNIKITLTPIKNHYIYLGYYGDKTFSVKDSAFLNNKSEGVFKGNKKLNDGMYSIAYPGGLFYFLVDKNYKFSITTNTASIDKIKFTGSPENTVFVNYLKYRNKNNELLHGLRTLYRTAHDPLDSASLIKEINDTLQSMQRYREHLVKKYPKSFFASMLKTRQDTTLSPYYPAAAANFFAERFTPYLVAHYWDGVQFYDTALLKTPDFDNRLDNYFDYYIPQNTDSVNKKIDWMMSYAGANEQTERFFLSYFLNRYYNPKQTWQEQVLIHIFEKYIAQKNYPWLAAKDKQQVADWVFRLMANAAGKPAADIELPDTASVKTILYNLKSPYTLVVFWNPLCSHCKIVLPQLDSFYTAKWKATGLQFFAVAMQVRDTREIWLSVIKELHLNMWNHVYYSIAEENQRIAKGMATYTQLYNVSIFPTLYLLDKDKKIIAKNLTPEQLDEILRYRK